MEFIKGYKENIVLRKSFNELAKATFGIEFEEWYKAGFWTDKYIPFSLVEHSKVIANVSVNELNLVINGNLVPAIQIGTVMTESTYRNRGFSRLLMEKILEEYKHIEIMYLFANKTVLDFYPKFGFEKVQETIFSMDIIPAGSNSPPKLGNLNTLYRAASSRYPAIHFGTNGTEELLMFYAMNVFSENLYYFEEDEIIAVCRYEEETLHLYDLISQGQTELLKVVNQLCTDKTSKVVFHFTPDIGNIQKEVYQGENVLFVRNSGNIKLPEEFKHPILSQA